MCVGYALGCTLFIKILCYNSLKRKHSLAGNRTPVSCVTDRDTHHYTTKDYLNDNEKYPLYKYKLQMQHVLYCIVQPFDGAKY